MRVFAILSLVCVLVNSEDIILNARCKSRCIHRVIQGRPLNDTACLALTECKICLELCDNLYEDYGTWSEVCQGKKYRTFCANHNGCSEACSAIKFLHTPSNGYNTRRKPFPNVDMQYNARTKEIHFYWSDRDFSDIKKPVVYIVYFLSSGDAWQKLSSTLNTNIKVLVNDGPQDYAFRIVAVIDVGPIASSPTIKYNTLVNKGRDKFKDKLDTFLDNLKSREAKLSSIQDTFHKQLNHSLTSFLKPGESSSNSVTGQQSGWENILIPATIVPVVIVLVALLIYTQRNHQMQLIEMRRTFTSWSSKVSSSFRNSIHSARRSIRKQQKRPDSSIHCNSSSPIAKECQVFLQTPDEKLEIPDSTCT